MGDGLVWIWTGVTSVCPVTDASYAVASSHVGARREMQRTQCTIATSWFLRKERRKQVKKKKNIKTRIYA